MTAARSCSARHMLAALLVCLSLAPLAARADDAADQGPICAALGRGTEHVAESAPGTDVYLGSGAEWLTDELKARYQQDPAASETASALRFQLQRVQATLEQSSVFQSANGKWLKERLLAELATIDTAVSKLDSATPVALSKLQGLYGLARLEQTTTYTELCQGKQYSSNSLYFEDAALPERVVLSAFAQESAGAAGLSIPVAATPSRFVTVAEASEFRAALQAVRALLSEPLLKALERTSLRLTQIHGSWSNYLEHGYSQYPWEAWINSAGELRWDRAPATQWIVLHPELAVVLDARQVKEAAAAPALLLHALGFALYGETRSWFVGLSATGVLTSNAALGYGAGATLHFGHTQLYSKVPHLSVAGLLFASDGGRLGPYIGVSADFWRLVSDSGEAQFNKALSQQQQKH